MQQLKKVDITESQRDIQHPQPKTEVGLTDNAPEESQVDSSQTPALGPETATDAAENGGHDLAPSSATAPPESGEIGKTGAAPPGTGFTGNAAFVAAVFRNLPKGARPIVCVKAGDPSKGGWFAVEAHDVDRQCPVSHNNYVNCSSYFPDDKGEYKARKENVAGFHLVILDDVETKVKRDRLLGFQPTYEIETSPGNFQVGFALSQPLLNEIEVNALQGAVLVAELCDHGASGIARWIRLPVGINGKTKYLDGEGKPFRVNMPVWNPDISYTLAELVKGLGLKLDAKTPQAMQAGQAKNKSDDKQNEVYTPKASVNPIVVALMEQGLYKREIATGKHDVTCPWVHEHTDQLDTGAAYFEPDQSHPYGGYRCQHSHGHRYRIRALFEYLGVSPDEARHKAKIRLIAGEMNRVVAASEKVLVARGNVYQSGGMIVRVASNPITCDALIVPMHEAALTKELAACADWERFDGRTAGFVRCDPSPRHVGLVYKAQSYDHLPSLVGLARQPYFRPGDGVLITKPGYDPVSRRYGAFQESQYVFPEFTMETARAALNDLEELIVEVPFATEQDKAANVAAILTAAVRPSLDYAPAYHVGAPGYGSGKSYLCAIIAAFAGPGDTKRVAYPSNQEEAVKMVFSLLLESPAVIEFDDMQSDWIPHGVINSLLSAQSITGRILGSSKTATVGTTVMVMGSGNNVGPVRDTTRRVIMINLNTNSESPATVKYKGKPLEALRANREKYVTKALTIIAAWKAAGSPRADLPSIATYGGAWTDYCRQPLVWLGYPDPAKGLISQIRHDPDAVALGTLLAEWFKVFGSTAVTVRKLISTVQRGHEHLSDAILAFPVAERGEINPGKFGWFLKKNQQRIVAGLFVQEAEADGRKAWRVTRVGAAPVSPVAPPYAGPGQEFVSIDQAGR